jgi:hypothetical protein
VDFAPAAAEQLAQAQRRHAEHEEVLARHLCLFADRNGDYDGEMVQVETIFRDGRWGAVLVEEAC